MSAVMRGKRPVVSALAVAAVFAFFFSAYALAGERTVVIATGPVAGAAFPAGGAICNLVNRETARHGLRCLVESTAGSKDNLQRLRRGEADLALVQSDWQYLAAHGGQGAGEPWPDLRAVYSTYALAVTVLARGDAGISTLEDLKHSRVNFGQPGSGTRAVSEELMGALGWEHDDFEKITESGVDETIRALCESRIDAAILPVSHPSGAVAAAVNGCGARIVEVSGPAIDALIEMWPFYAPARIRAGLYRGQDGPVQTYGMRATLVATASTPDEVVAAVVRATFDNIQLLTAQHPVLAGLTRPEMATAAIVAPYHEAAARYYHEAKIN